MTDTQRELDERLAERVAALGFELVELERAGSRTRPILRLRVDRPGSAEGAGITVGECARLSRALEAELDEDPHVAERYVLEVSSPGVERPLVRADDFGRFAGREVALKLHLPLPGRGKRLEGELLGLAEEDGQERIRLVLKDGETINIPRADVARAHLIFRWE
jgi:ribosome maturation factor RimP